MKKLAVLGLIALSGVAAHADQLYNNGPAVNANGKSILFSATGNYGFGAQTSAANSVADDFTVTGDGWNVSDVDLFAYQTGAGSFSFTDATWSIVSGDLNGANTVVASGTTSVTNGGLVGYRVTKTTLGNQDRGIYDVNVDIPDVTLAAGDYWLVYSLNGSSSFSGPWVPPTSNHVTGDAMQSVAGGSFAPLLVTGSRTTELPFILNGTVAAVPEPATWASLALGLGLLGFMRSRRRAD